MKNKDTIKQEKMEILQRLRNAAKEGDDELFTTAFSDLAGNIEQYVLAEAKEMMNTTDITILASRGVRQLTSDENKFYQAWIKASKSPDIKQELKNIQMPETIIDTVFDEIETQHPLLSKINFMNTTGLTRILSSKNGVQKAIWGQLNSKIIQELLGSFEEKDMTLLKLSAFIPVSKDMLKLGPQYLDKYVRTILYEAICAGLEEAVVCGDGKDKIIGMDRYVGDDVTVTGGVYPEKTHIKVNRFDPVTIGNICAMMAVDKSGKPRIVTNIALLVNPQDYYQKVMPATTVLTPDGTYRNDVMPVKMDIIQTIALQKGKAVIGMMHKMFVGVGMNSTIDYSDEYQFLEDNRIYLEKMLANGYPMDNNAFQVLDISELQPTYQVVEVKTPPEPSNDATLSSLSFGSLILSPTFNKATKTYTAEKSNATNTVTAVPSDAQTKIVIKFNDVEVPNGSSVRWKDGSNTVVIETSNGTGKETYTVTVKDPEPTVE